MFDENNVPEFSSEDIPNESQPLPYASSDSSEGSGSYSIKGSDIPDNVTHFSPLHSDTEPERRDNAPKNNFTSPPHPYTQIPASGGKNGKKGPSWGAFIALGCICIVLSLLAGVFSGALTAFFLSESGIINRGNVYSEDASVKISYAESEHTPTITAADIAKDSVVVIDVYTAGASLSNATKVGSGSGVIWTENGYIVTCNHVVDGGNLIVVTLYSGERFEANVIGRDPQTDLAVIKIDIPEDVELKSSTVRATDAVLGESVIAIGNPLGTLSNTVTDGIISCLERQITVEGQSMTLMQTNAAVNPGNSGGGLFDTNGALIGIVNAKSSEQSVEGIGFAIPIGTVMKISADLIENGYVTGRPSLGFESVFIDSTNYNQYPALEEYAVSGTWFLRVTSGVYVTDTSGVSGYEGKNTLLFGDRITQINNTRISSMDDLITAISKSSVGDTVTVTVSRQKQTVQIQLILGEAGN